VFVWLDQFSRKGTAKTGGIYDLVIADPPYDRPQYRRDAEGGDAAEPPMDQTARLLVETPWTQLLNKYGIFVLEQSVERPVDLAPGLDMLRYRRYGKTLVVYYALPGSYEVKENREAAAEEPEGEA
jgi:16S rRNA G966 N2-methylase RsmD